jgi:NAD(P)H-quinone oxidoreductase subunit 5
MTGEKNTRTVGPLPNRMDSTARLPAIFTRLVWLLWVASLVVVGVRVQGGGDWGLSGVFAVDGLTVVMWVVVTFLSGIVHSYSRRYMAGSEAITRFFTGLFGFTLTVMVLVAADHVGLFAAAWLGMGLVMADLVGTARGWPQARAAASLARRYFLASSALLGIALVTLWSATDATTVSGIVDAVGIVSDTTLLLAATALLLAAMIQSALVPFHAWLLSSMTAPTPASALMHAGFVNAGGVLFVRFAPVVEVEPGFMLVVVAVGAASALLGKLLKSVQTDVKSRLGCSTTGQMGFMLMQAGLGYFGAALTHLVLHGFYKAYLFLGSGGQVEHTSPSPSTPETGGFGVVGAVVTALIAVAGGALFAVLTGKGTTLDSGILLTGLVTLTTLHATQTVVRQRGIRPGLRYGAIPVVFLPSIAVYAGAYNAITGLLGDLPLVTASATLTPVHVAVAAAFGAAYVLVELERYQHSQRLYVRLLNATHQPTETLTTSPEEYNEY